MKAGWEVARFSDVCQLRKGKKPKLSAVQSPDSLPYLVARFLRGVAEPAFASRDDKNAVLVSKNQFFVICDGSNSGEIFAGYEGILSSTMALVDHDEKINSAFLSLFLESLFEQFN